MWFVSSSVAGSVDALGGGSVPDAKLPWGRVSVSVSGGAVGSAEPRRTVEALEGEDYPEWQPILRAHVTLLYHKIHYV